MMPGKTPGTGRASDVVIIIAVFLCSWLLFSLEPLSSKLLLPRLGGTPTVWITCLLFFQAALLVGYAYADFSIRLLGLRRQAILHAVLIAASFFFIPISLDALTPPDGMSPIVWLLRVLTSSIGIPFVVLSSFGPIAQRWFAHAGPEAEKDPYFLYAAGNLGSLLALLSYPFLLEPRLTLGAQTQAWSGLYAIVLTVVVLMAMRVASRASSPSTGAVQATDDSRVGIGERIRWLLYAAVPSSMLMGTTSFLSMDIGSFPLLWVLPLALYLLTFTLVFAKRPPIPHWIVVKAESQLIVVVSLTIFWAVSLPGVFSVFLHLMLLFLVAMVCHGELAQTRPSAKHLTDFYLWLAIGGFLGGLFNAVVAPVIFNDVFEYPLAIVAAALLRPGPKRKGRTLDFIAPAALCGALFLATWRPGAPPQLWPTVAMIVTGIALFSFRDYPGRFSLAVAVLFLIGIARQASPITGSVLIDRERSFFGVYHVMQDSVGKVRMLEHGSTLHGAQALRPGKNLIPLSYYSPAGPAGDLFRETVPALVAAKRVGVVGLGVGSLTCYGKPDEQWTYYEIDPLVARIATDTTHFTFLRDCPATPRIVFGDARLTIAGESENSFDILVIDAFSSDAIPIHLLTIEAFREYMRVIGEGGILAVHISNQHMQLEPLVAALAKQLGLKGRVRYDLLDIRTLETPVDRLPSAWVILSRNESAFGKLTSRRNWEQLWTSHRVKPWTDDFSNILSVIRWD